MKSSWTMTGGVKKTDHRLAFELIVSGVSLLQIFNAQQNNSISLHPW